MSISPCHVSRFSLEFQLACACCRVKPNSDDIANIRRLLPLVNVPAFVELVIARHRIGPLVHAALKQLPPDALPSGLMAPLAAEARGNLFKALRAVRTHVLMDRWFKAAGIAWLPFKGCTLAQRYYGDVGLRQVNDQDLWVPEDKLEAARAVLASHGFTWDPRKTSWDLASRGPRHRRFLMGFHIEEQHLSAEYGRIELHWQLTNNFHLFKPTPEQLLQRADRIRIGLAGESLPVLNSIDLLLYLCDHGGRHCWYRLKWLADLPQLLDRETWQWDEVFERASAAGCTSSLTLGLALARDLFGWQPPAAVAHVLRATTSLPGASQVVQRALNAPNEWWTPQGAPPLGWWLRSLWSRTELTNWRAHLVVVRRLILTPADLRAIAFPDRLFVLYRLARPVLFLWRRFRGDAKTA